MPRIASATKIANAASGIDLADDTLAGHQRPNVRQALDHADKLMSNRSLKTGIAARNLQIGVADSRKRHADDGLAIADRLWHGRDLQSTILITKSLHKTRGRRSEVRGQQLEANNVFWLVTSDL